MVLIDSSIWIRLLADRAPEAAQAQELIALGTALSHDLVYGELLIGDRGTRGPLLANLNEIVRVPTVPHADVVHFVRERRLLARGLSWIDAHLLAATLVAHARLWTADGPLQQAATTLGVAYHVG
jgi:predicted nucleic acid-binding protein